MLDKKIHTALKAYEELGVVTMQYRNHRKIANDPLPPKKQKKLDDLVTQVNVKRFNAQSKFDNAFGKLNQGQQQIFFEELQ